MTAKRVGLIGAGGIANEHLPGWLGLGYEVVVHSLEGAAELTARHGGRVVDSLDELFAFAEIVDIVTPTPTHRDLVERAAAAGKHVVCEKPLAPTVPDCVEMIAACDRAGVRLFPAHVVRYFPAYAALRQAVAAGAVGPVAVQRFFRIGAAPSRPWFRDRAVSGGIAMDQMIHDFDQARWIAGDVRSVHARQSGADAPGSSTTVQAVLRHESGAITHVNGVWGASSLSFHTGFTVAGEHGMLEHDSRRHPVLGYDGLANDASSGYLPPVDHTLSPYAAELADFARAIHDGDAAAVDARDGMEAVRIAAAVNRSLDEGTEVLVEQIMSEEVR